MMAKIFCKIIQKGFRLQQGLFFNSYSKETLTAIVLYCIGI